MELVPEEFRDGASGLADQAGLPREQLSGLIEAIDSRFNSIGASLGEAVNAFDAIISALQDVVGAFEHSGMAQAVEDITAAARAMYNVTDQIDRREHETARIPAASKRLHELSQEIVRSLKMLRIYGVNIKIAASGAPDFIAFVDDISVRLSDGEAAMQGFGELLGGLGQSLDTLRRNDQSLARECQSVVPQVPDRLIADVEALRDYQNELAQLAQTTGEIARAVQQEVGEALCAIQVGDRARQRLEHVLAGMAVIEAASIDDHEATAQMRAHGTALLRAQTEATREEFDRDLQSLVTALYNLQPPTQRLNTLLAGRAGEDSADDEIFLRRLEQGISEAARMTESLVHADRQASLTMNCIVDIVADVAARAKTIGALRVEIQDMAVNVSLKARRAGPTGPPIKVVADEIRQRSEVLDAITDSIGAVENELLDVAERMTQLARQQSESVGSMLSRSLDSIRSSAEKTETSIKLAADITATILPILGSATQVLETCEEMSAQCDAILAEMADEGLCANEAINSADHPLTVFMEAMARSYTMAEERAVHDRFLLPGMQPLGGGAKVAESQDEDLFDSFDDCGPDRSAPPVAATAGGEDDDPDLDDVFF
jgi:methyl-accepting chemotaxis protein